jgi:hypothetical protein
MNPDNTTILICAFDDKHKLVRYYVSLENAIINHRLSKYDSNLIYCQHCVEKYVTDGHIAKFIVMVKNYKSHFPNANINTKRYPYLESYYQMQSAHFNKFKVSYVMFQYARDQMKITNDFEWNAICNRLIDTTTIKFGDISEQDSWNPIICDFQESLLSFTPTVGDTPPVIISNLFMPNYCMTDHSVAILTGLEKFPLEIKATPTKYMGLAEQLDDSHETAKIKMMFLAGDDSSDDDGNSNNNNYDNDGNGDDNNDNDGNGDDNNDNNRTSLQIKYRLNGSKLSDPLSRFIKFRNKPVNQLIRKKRKCRHW